MHFFITGHTGFKGAWLTMLLKELGHEVSGYSLEPVIGGLFERSRLQTQLTNHYISDIRDSRALKSALESCRPDFAIHLAAQPLVLKSYEDPLETYTTNVDGTRNFLQAVTESSAPPVTLVITTDKVYRDDHRGPYRESDPLGGHDPYSSSKAMSDIMTQSWAATNPNLRIHIARSGNVIGSFDVAENRLIPDAIRAIQSDRELVVRNPSAIRPWQHVLDCLSGYLAFLFSSASGAELPVALNFGPDSSNVKTVEDVLDTASNFVNNLKYKIENSKGLPKETDLLTLDSSEAKELLGWRNLIDFEKAIELSFAHLGAQNSLATVSSQIKEFIGSSRYEWLR